MQWDLIYLISLVAIAFLPYLSEFPLPWNIYPYLGALIYILLPIWACRKSLSKEFANIRLPKRRDFLWGIGTLFAILPFFLIGFHFWETHILHKNYKFSWEHYLQWDQPLRMSFKTESGVQIRGYGNWLDMKWQALSSSRSIEFMGDPLVLVQQSGGIHIRGNSRHWKLDLNDQGRVIWKVSQNQNKYHFVINGKGAIYVGGAKVSLPYEFHFGLKWIWSALWMQWMVVALAEEWFFRAYLQREVAREWPGKFQSIPLSKAIVWTSVLFALAHLSTYWSLSRVAVFFPSLIFGWLYERTGKLWAPVIVHGGSNLMVILTQVHYWS